jgi:hypothetical protein
MAIKKSELYSSLWASCDQLRGGMDASQYKDYVLVLLFVKYVSDKYAGHKDALIDVPAGGGFADMLDARGDAEIGDRMNKIIARLAEANQLGGVIDVANFNDPDKLGSGKDMVDRLTNLLNIFNQPGLDFKGNTAEGDDLLGDAYEYLMRNFATESGKSKGQFYTPAEVSRIMAKVIGAGNATSSDQTIYDPTCGSGSLLLKAHDEARGGKQLDLTIYGQENDVATRALAKMNMILHDCPAADIWRGNTLAAPYFFRETLDYDYLGTWIDRPNNRNVEPDLLRAYLKRQGYDDVLATRAVHELERAAGDASQSLYDRNKTVYELLRYGVKVTPEAGENTETVWPIDWDHPDNNDFAIAEEVTVAGAGAEAYDKRPDVVLYVNGIALGVLEYIVVHELVHLLERRHNDRFASLMDGALPGWRLRRDELNREPLRHEEWAY